MSLTNHRTLISAAVALLVGLAIYGIAQGSDLLPLGAQSAPQPAPQEEAPKAAAPAVVQQEMTVPSGAVMHFDLDECPDGWTELTAAQGRYIVGLPDPGARGATVGTPLTDQENRAVGQHTHTVNDPGHGHTVNDTGHSHAVNDPGHSHGVNDPGHHHGGLGDYDGAQWGGLEQTNDDSGAAGDDDDDDLIPILLDAFTGISIQSAGTSISLASNTTGVSVNNNTTGATVENAGSVAGTNAPYIQLLVCRKD